MNRSTRKLQFSQKARKEIYERDGMACYFCMIRYRMPAAYEAGGYETRIMETMHIVSRSHGGMGIAENGMLGCKYHHRMLDAGAAEIRKEMQDLIGRYMKQKYPGWDRERLVFRKGTL